MNDIILTALLTCTVIVLCIAAFNEYYQWRVGVSCMPTMPKVRRRFLSLIKQYATKDHANVVELGCGWGGLAIAAAKDNPDKKITGVELSLMPYLISKLRPKKSNANIRHKNIHDFDLTQTDIVLCYLSNQHMEALENKMQDELKPGSFLISSTFVFAKKQPCEVIQLTGSYDTKMYVYAY